MIALFVAALPGSAPEPRPAAEAEVQALVARARQGDQVAARSLYRLHANRVYRAVRPFAASDDEAEEVVQETFVRAFAALDRYRPSPRAHFVSWLLTVATNRARSRARRRKTASLPVDHETLERLGERAAAVEPPPSSPSAEEEDDPRAAALLAVLAELDDRSRQVLTLRYGGGLTSAEVGRVLGLREATVRKQCQRLRPVVLERVRDRLRAEDDEPVRPGVRAEEARATP